MAVYEKKVKKDIEKVLEETRAFFGPGGEGLEITQDEPCCLSFSGGGGHVSVSVSNEQSEKMTTLEIETREWDYQVRQFLKKI
ncbi:MAG: hypothetical protein R6V67_10295 [Spirochaetia bacterium]